MEEREILNPKDLVGATKVPLEILPPAVMAEVAVGLLEGSLKYGRDNVVETAIQSHIYIGAAKRHIDQWQAGEDTDPDSCGLSHITKAIAALVVMRHAMTNGMCVDTRPRGCVGFMEELSEKVKQLQAKYQDPKPPNLADGREPREYQGG